MGDRKRRWICRLIFVGLCALPTILVLSFLPNRPTAHSISSDFSHLLGLPVTVAEVQTPTPFKTILKNVRVHDPELGTLLLLNQIELTRSVFSSRLKDPVSKEGLKSDGSAIFGAWDRWQIDSAQVTENGLPFLSARFHETLLRLRRRTGFPIDIQSLQVVQKSEIDPQRWEQLVASERKLSGKTVLRMKNVKFDRVTSSQMAVAVTKSQPQKIPVPAADASSDRGDSFGDQSALRWRSGWNLSAQIANPSLVSWTDSEPVAPINIEFHRIRSAVSNPLLDHASTDPSHSYQTYWAATIGQAHASSKVSPKMIPWHWVATKFLRKHLDLHPSGGSNIPLVGGQLSGTIGKEDWEVQVEKFWIDQMQMSDLDRLVCGNGKDRISGLCNLLFESTQIQNGKVTKSNFGIWSSSGQVAKQLALELNSSHSVQMFLEESPLDIVQYTDLRLLVETNRHNIRIQPLLDHHAKNSFAATNQNGKELLRFEKGKIYSLKEVVAYLDRRKLGSGSPERSTASPISIAFLNETLPASTANLSGGESSRNTAIQPVQYQTNREP